jgi:RNA polymerase sigma factor (sigma-70 family)
MDAAKLFAELHAPLYRYLVRLTGDADLAHDAAQEAFVRLVTKPPRAGQTKAWLFTVATNVVRAWANKQQRRRVLLEAGAGRMSASDPLPDPEQVMLADERRSAVRGALDSLSERERAVLLMREEGFTHREIAQAIGTTTGSIGSMVARALDKLAAALPLDADTL